MNQLFQGIVALFLLACQATGLSYAELNILVYCALVPLSWILLVVWRDKRFWPVLLAQLLVFLFLLRHFRLGAAGQHFYNYNITVLEKMGRTTGLGYVAVSLLMGVLIPVISLALLLGAPRRWAAGLYLVFVAALVAYFLLGQSYTAMAAPGL
ncbi:hypothetical protein [Hymenobacter sp. DG25A]|uniref:hypothetical protein n=1 Tax=Hymenobacter sp. DG25A TaxID=1385663 RepID=UPI0006BD2AE8|nr:hypothetical protein [Hymenobacter sp. DG25A]ALD20548.1 hypothetical protein AM218_04075 [Hymenobacter sp. DG25A]